MALFLAPLALESSIFPIRDEAFVFRSYPCLLGSGLCFAWGMSWAGKRSSLLPGTALGLLAVLTAVESWKWTDPLGLTRRDLRAAPRQPLTWYNDAQCCRDAGLPDAAEAVARRCLRIPYHPKLLGIYLLTLMDLGRFTEAQERIALEERLYPNDAFLLQARIVLAARMGHRPIDGASWESVGSAFLKQGRLVDAESAYRRALSSDPSLFTARNNLGGILLGRGSLPEAELMLREALRLNPGSAGAWRNLAAVLAREGREEEARDAEARCRASSSP